MIDQPAIKPGWRTTEFWLSASAVLLGILYASGIVTADGPLDKIAGLAATLLGALGYTVARGKVKAAGAMLIVVLLAGIASQPACSAAQRSDAKHSVIDCAKADALSIASLLAKWGIDSAINREINYQAIEAEAWKHGAIIGGCSVDRFVQSTNAHQVASVLPMPVSEGDAMMARLSARWGGVEWQ